MSAGGSAQSAAQTAAQTSGNSICWLTPDKHNSSGNLQDLVDRDHVGNSSWHPANVPNRTAL